MVREGKARSWLVFCSGLLLLLILWCGFAYGVFGLSIPQMMNAYFYLLPVNLLLTVCFFVFIVGGAVQLHKRCGKFPKTFGVVGGVLLGLSILYPVLAVPLLSESTSTQRKAFSEAISLQNLISSEYAEDDFRVRYAQRWDNTVYLRGEVSVNTDKLSAFDSEIRAQFSDIIGVVGEEQYIQNVPSPLQKYVDTALHFNFDDVCSVFSWFDETLIETTEYADVKFTVYYDSGMDFKEERIALLAQYGDDYLLFTLRFEGDGSDMHLRKETVMQKTAEFLKQAAWE